jgi:antitoxin (DNA-binding transcriptional repressor) of toxin-antitoxin stability system
MQRSSVSAAKDKPSARLALVQRGEAAVITDRRVPVAQLPPLPAAMRHDEVRTAEAARPGQARRHEPPSPPEGRSP